MLFFCTLPVSNVRRFWGRISDIPREFTAPPCLWARNATVVSMAIIRVLKGPISQREFVMIPQEESACELLIGRDAQQCQLVMPPRSVSRVHARVAREGDIYLLRDLNSKAGTLLNGSRVKPNVDYRLKHCDLIHICEYVLSFIHPEQSTDSGSSTEALTMVEEGAPGYGSALDSSAAALAERAGANAAAKLAALMQLTQELRNTVELDRLLAKVLDSLLVMFSSAYRSVVILEGRHSGDAPWQLARVRDPGEQDRMVVNRSIIDHVLKTHHALAPASGEVMCLPLLDRDERPLGILQLDADPEGPRFDTQDLDLALTVAWQISFVIENALLQEAAMRAQALETELEIAHEIQAKLLPANRPEVPGYDFFDFYEAARQVGGDYFDYREMPDGRLAILLGDVSGKGVPAALLMAKVSTELNVFLASGMGPVEAVTEVNRRFVVRSPFGSFMTLILAALDPVRHHITLVNAGHIRPLLRTSDGTISEVGIQQFGLPLGILPEAEYRKTEFDLEPGDALLMVTDGITEAHYDGVGRLYGSRRLRERYRTAQGTATQIGRWIMEGIRLFVGENPATDDKCLLCLRRKPHRDSAETP